MTGPELLAAADIALDDAERSKGSPLTVEERSLVVELALHRLERADWDAHGRDAVGPVTDEERRGRRLFLMAKERAAGEETWWWLSFVNDDAFQGCVMLRAFGPVDAVDRAWKKGVNPGGECQMTGAPPGWEPLVDGFSDRLLTKDDVAAFDAARDAAEGG